ncbi:MAG: Dual specificity protein phosphatase [Candidatus Amesbacteria bacterium GW2011_GWB1_47_19]|nr:MAG: Dual specificity protein phosphatase [Candidatus Amesbacteria bacterium GW2011_GWA1_44_24]KKU31831.1 MAG: hypothetical protein UX46_C0002G0047 [Candidatus Amesbacteria bacterium GW2011_GWC1_46_24]KKU66767.1 MAG: Dual specificity protein phosphatase [Candidatus Amesbacteria bacterium GW2011_GWB1_47_19]OGD05920.1 MAG: hypothetical protein A2379_00080 [Candidatus Amesbacteria bacterium RIFOXYB1_FULL_47_13]HBC73133.1 hypothetical protein [Candidatus Amesbacteria bacterium]
MIMDGHRTDYSQITENIIIGSDLCPGPGCPVHSEEFKNLGVCAEVNLEIERNEKPTPGIDVYLWLPTEDKQAPNPDQLAIGTAAINEMVKTNKTIYVHCRNGHGRSPTMVAAYLIRYRNMGVSEAIALIKQKRPEIHPEEVQIKALEEFYKTCA